jgi:TPR repeat protein
MSQQTSAVKDKSNTLLQREGHSRVIAFSLIRSAFLGVLLVLGSMTYGYTQPQVPQVPQVPKLEFKQDDCADLYAAKLYAVALTTCQHQSDAKEPHAQFILGLMHYYGQGTVQDFAKAFILFKKAAKLGHIGAQNNVGFLYFNGQSVPQDFIRAYVWFSLSAAAGYQDAARYRDMAAAKLSSDQRGQGQAMATACTNTKFEMCE